MRTRTGTPVRLEKYEPTPYTTTEVSLRFELDPTETIVTARSRFERRDGTAAGASLELDGDGLSLVSAKLDGERIEPEHGPDALRIARPPAGPFELEVVTRIDPSANTQLSGLYVSNGVFCTQCEAEGFRRITYFLDRPDVLATYDVEIVADRDARPIQLSNGNRVTQQDGRVVWHDPHPKPSYLFALVAGDLDTLTDEFTTAGGRRVALAIHVEKGKRDLATYAMGALKRSMRWDEERFGREYDLDEFNIVAVSDFNMGAMENKGLNIFNDKYVLADPELSTDTDYANIEAIVAHEYFHNWTGNRITCRDWFQLCLKEGLTVYRDQEFSSDTRSRTVERIAQVQRLKATQFPEDAGPLAHPVRPSIYEEINNFYTATVYQKGAELVRMIETILGRDGFRTGLDLYFDRHDGDAATVEEFLACFRDASGLDDRSFMTWYEQAGTPLVRAEVIDGHVHLTQSYAPHLARQGNGPVPIPIRWGTLDDEEDRVFVLEQPSDRFPLPDADARPSLLRGFSAPVDLTFPEGDERLADRALEDPDDFNRWDAIQRLAERVIVSIYEDRQAKALDALAKAMARASREETLEPAFRARCLALPTEMDVALRVGENVDPDRIMAARRTVFDRIAEALGDDAVAYARSLGPDGAYCPDIEEAGLRALRNGILMIRSDAGYDDAFEAALIQFETSRNMTDRLAALSMLTNRLPDRDEGEAALETFRERYAGEPIVMDKWLSLQAALPGDATLARVDALSRQSTFSIENPNRVRSLLGVFSAANPTGFHRADGAAYEFLARRLIELDDRNPQVAARIATAFRSYRIYDERRREAARAALQRVAEKPNLSRDLGEIVKKMLAF